MTTATLHEVTLTGWDGWNADAPMPIDDTICCRRSDREALPAREGADKVAAVVASLKALESAPDCGGIAASVKTQLGGLSVAELTAVSRSYLGAVLHRTRGRILADLVRRVEDAIVTRDRVAGILRTR